MTLQLLSGRWWKILCNTSGMLLNYQKGCIYVAESGMILSDQSSDVHQGNPEVYPDTILHLGINLISIC